MGLGAAGDGVALDRDGVAGEGLARGGAPVYVPFALPGERVSAERDGGRARLLTVEDASPDRAEPFCPHFGRCGGCVAQHMGPTLYGPWKRDRLVAALDDAGVTASVGPLVAAHGAGRRRVVFHARPDPGGAMRVGFMEARSHRLVSIERCPVTVEALRDAAPAAARLAGALARTGKPIDISTTATLAGLDVEIRGTGPLSERLRQRCIALAGELDLARLSLHGEVLIERRPPLLAIGPVRVRPPPGAFVQATEAGEAALAAAVEDALDGTRRVADLFAGLGPLALRLAGRAEIHAVDGDRAMLAALDRAARETPGLRRVTTETRDLFRRPLLPIELDRFDGLVLDPPRAGAEAQVGQIAASAVARVAMVSCDPGTFARDAATLVGAGFALGRVTPVDQFAWSAHLEVVGVFARPLRRRRTGRRAL